MKKIVSFKMYNIVAKSGNTNNGAELYIKFYNQHGKLIILDFTNPISSTSTYCETSQCIITSYRSENYDFHYPQCSFHTGNYNKTVGLNRIGIAYWLQSPIKNDYVKIEFKIPQYFSDIKILNSVYKIGTTTYYAESFDYLIEYSDGNSEINSYTYDGTEILYSSDEIRNNSYDQDVYDSLFKSLKFNKSKQTYDTKIGYIETLEANNFRNITVNTVKRLKVLYSKPENTLLSCTVSFDQGQTWKTFNGTNWLTISDTSPENMILNCMSIGTLNQLDKNKLVSGGFIGNLDFKMVMKTNDENKTPSVTKIYIEYK